MVVAAMTSYKGGEGLKGANHAIELAIVFVAMFIIGPGKYSIDKH
jgi:putative oxidoreductase